MDGPSERAAHWRLEPDQRSPDCLAEDGFEHSQPSSLKSGVDVWSSTTMLVSRWNDEVATRPLLALGGTNNAAKSDSESETLFSVVSFTAECLET